MQRYLKVFKPLLKKLNGENMVLAGTLALKAHGLKMSRDATDLDVVIFNPTKEQLQFLESLQTLALNMDAMDYPIESTRVLKFKKDNLCIYILLENKPTPPELLIYKYDGDEYQVQDIAYNMEAKNSFRTNGGRDRRTKDVVDTLDLKQSNFNL